MPDQPIAEGDQTPEQSDNSARPEDGDQGLSQDPNVAYVSDPA